MPENDGYVVNSFDGIIKDWPRDGEGKVLSIPVLTIPKNNDDFILYMTCELYKNQYLEQPRKQAEECFSYACALASVLSAHGLI